MPYYSRLKMQTEAQENKIQEKDSKVLRLLNQIATDMIRKSDVDRLVEEAVAKATAASESEGRKRWRQGPDSWQIYQEFQEERRYCSATT